jgi:type II restriction enzyme
MPDVVLHHVDRNWLVLVGGVTSHGPMDPKRVDELTELFDGCSAGLVFVTAVPDGATYRGYHADLAWDGRVGAGNTESHDSPEQ